MKKYLILVLIICMLCAFLVTTTSCDQGLYAYDGVLGEGTIKLASFGKVIISTKIDGLTYNETGKYKFSKKDDNGNKKIVITINGKTLNGYLNSDDQLIIENIYRFTK